MDAGSLQAWRKGGLNRKGDQEGKVSVTRTRRRKRVGLRTWNKSVQGPDRTCMPHAEGRKGDKEMKRKGRQKELNKKLEK